MQVCMLAGIPNEGMDAFFFYFSFLVLIWFTRAISGDSIK
jgi:hypothetical protein